MSYGYSARVIKANRLHDEKYLGVKLGRLCIALDIPVSAIAKDAGVSKQTVYNWFVGKCDPHPSLTAKIQELITQIENHK